MADEPLKWQQQAEVLATQAIAADEPTAWFDRLYAAGRRGDFALPWDKQGPNQLLAGWALQQAVDGSGRKAVVVGSGLGQDSEFVAGLGFDTVAFDVSDTAVDVVRGRFPDSPVHYTVANLLDLPAEWWQAFDLVVEIYTVQALPVALREQAIASVAGLVAPGGTLLVIQSNAETEPPRTPPPWPLTRAQIESFGDHGLVPASIEPAPGDHWLAEFRR
jgi:2-polyprenyl-3-methyl-5-hydroxy-6-metoxy-1,4-benzoquinol methylase